MVQLEFNKAQTTLSLHAYKNGRFIEKADAKVQLGAEQRATWVAMHIKVENGVLSANLPGAKPLTYEAAWPLNGSIGLFISGYTQNPNPVRFRHLQFGSW